MDKVFASTDAAVADLGDGSSLAVGGFGAAGVPHRLLDAVLRRGASELHIYSNNPGREDFGLGALFRAKRIARSTHSFIGGNDEMVRQYINGQIEVELVPQGTLAERLRAGGAGIAAFYTPAGVGTLVADGGLPWRYGADGSIAVASPPKPTQTFTLGGETREYVLEEGIVCDYALVRAAKGDRHGNLVFHRAARNFNPLCAAAGRVTIAEVEQLYEPGELDPDEIHTPGIYVQRVVPVGTEGKRIEILTTRDRGTAGNEASSD